MAYLYVDTDGSGATAPYETWAKAAQTLQVAITAASAGDIIYMQGAAADTAATSRTLTSPVTDIDTPIKIVGVLNGTTNVDGSITTSDFAPTSGTQPHFEVTGAGNDLSFTANDMFEFSFIQFSTPDRINVSSDVRFYQCDIVCDNFLISNAYLECRDCEINIGNDADGGSGFNTDTAARLDIYGGTISNPTSQTYLNNGSGAGLSQNFTGVDMSGLTITNIERGTTFSEGVTKLVNCRLAFTNRFETAPSKRRASVELIGVYSGTTAVTTSRQDYAYEDNHGVVVNEPTIVRTGGADDGSEGSFSYKMTTRADAVMEGTFASLKSPWIRQWVATGSQTLTVFIVNDGADLTEDECWCEMYTPNNSDAANHTLTIATNTNNSFAQIDENAAAITDDTGSTWTTVDTFKQKFELTINPGFAGWAYARVHVAKRQPSGIYNIYVDPKIEIT